MSSLLKVMDHLAPNSRIVRVDGTAIRRGAGTETTISGLHRTSNRGIMRARLSRRTKQACNFAAVGNAMTGDAGS